jgi:hypothetical protein
MSEMTERIDVVLENLDIMSDTIKEASSLLKSQRKILAAVTGEKRQRKTRRGRRKKNSEESENE